MKVAERYVNLSERQIKDTQNQSQSFLSIKQICVLLNQQNARIKELEEQVEELKGKRLSFYKDDVRQIQVINGVHFDIEQLLVFSEYVEHKNNTIADYKKENQQLKEDLQAKDILVNTYMSVVGTLDNTKQLKQSQNQKAIECLEKVKECLLDFSSVYWSFFVKTGNAFMTAKNLDDFCNEHIDNQIKELRGEKNGKVKHAMLEM